MKKVLSLVLVIAMVLSSMSFAFAGTFTDIADTDYAKAVETLTALGVVTGYEDGTYRPDKTVTRAEMAKLIVEILGYGDLVAGSKSQFTDTQGHWADPWIALAAGKGLVLGTGEGKFTPDRTVSYDEAITMVVRALGYTDASNELKSMTWPTNFKVKAAELGLTKDVKLATAGADRGGVAQLLFNALTATLVTVNSDGDIIKSTTQTTDSQGKVVVEYTELLSRIADYDSSFVVSTDKLDPKNKNYAGDKVDLEPYMFQNLKVYLNDDDEVVYVKGTNSLVVEGEIDEVTENAAKTLVTVAIENAAGKIEKVTFTTDAAKGKTDDLSDSIFENGAIRTVAKTYSDLTKTETIKIVADDDNGNGNGKINETEVLGFVLTEQTKVALVEKEYVDGKTKVDVFTLPTEDDEVDLDNVTVTGAADSLEDIEIDDVVVEYKSNDGTVTKLVVSRETVEGEVTRIDGKNFYIDGTKYTRNSLVLTAWDLGDEGTFFLDHNGKIVEFEGTSGPTSYAVVMGSDNGTKIVDRVDATKFKVDDYPVIKLATQEDEAITYEVAVSINSDGTIKSSAKLNKNALVTASAGAGALSLTAMPAAGQIVKYTIDENDRISKITTVTQSQINYTDVEKLVFADNAVIFDATAGEDYAVVSVGRLKDATTGTNDRAVYNSNGEIVVLLTDDVKLGTDTTFAYISKINDAKYDGENVQLIVAYMNGEKVEYYTEEDDTVGSALDDTVVEFELDGVIIAKATAATGLVSASTTASAVYAKVDRIELSNGSSFYLADDATIITIEADGDVVLSDLNDIEEGVSDLEVYKNTDGEISFIVIHE